MHGDLVVSVEKAGVTIGLVLNGVSVAKDPAPLG
jgi:hypothetical protein